MGYYCQHTRSCWSAYSNFRVWWSIANIVMCLLGWAKSSTTKPSCAHQHCSLQGKKRRQRWLRAYVSWGRGLVFNHKDRPSMALPWTTMYEAFSLKIAGERGPWVRKHLYRNNSANCEEQCDWSYLSTSGMFIGSYGSSFCSMPGWLPATEVASTLPSIWKIVRFVKYGEQILVRHE